MGGNQGGSKGMRYVQVSKYLKSKIDWFVIPPDYEPVSTEYVLPIIEDDGSIEELNDINTRN